MVPRGCNTARRAAASTARARSEHLVLSKLSPTSMRTMEVLLLLLSAACLGCAQAAAASSETQTLLNFKASITDGGGDLAQWSPADLSPCNWTGVRCSAGVVTELSLQDMNVSGPVPIGLGMQLLLFLAMDYACSLTFFRSVTYSRSFTKLGLKFEVSSIRDTDLSLRLISKR